jgi:hypothetical protein
MLNMEIGCCWYNHLGMAIARYRLIVTKYLLVV